MSVAQILAKGQLAHEIHMASNDIIMNLIICYCFYLGDVMSRSRKRSVDKNIKNRLLLSGALKHFIYLFYQVKVDQR